MGVAASTARWQAYLDLHPCVEAPLGHLAAWQALSQGGAMQVHSVVWKRWLLAQASSLAQNGALLVSLEQHTRFLVAVAMAVAAFRCLRYMASDDSVASMFLLLSDVFEYVRQTH